MIMNWRPIAIAVSIVIAVTGLCLVAGHVFAGTLPADLSWSNPINTVDQIQIEKSGVQSGPYTVIVTMPAGATSYQDATNNPGSTQCYRAAYLNSSGVGPYAGPVCKTFPALPASSPGAFTVK